MLIRDSGAVLLLVGLCAEDLQHIQFQRNLASWAELGVLPIPG